jgi:hypothetical protein
MTTTTVMVTATTIDCAMKRLSKRVIGRKARQSRRVLRQQLDRLSASSWPPFSIIPNGGSSDAGSE